MTSISKVLCQLLLDNIHDYLQEINNLEDDSVISEVHLLRTFAERGFDVLYPEERAGADFNHFGKILTLLEI